VWEVGKEGDGREEMGRERREGRDGKGETGRERREGRDGEGD